MITALSSVSTSSLILASGSELAAMTSTWSAMIAEIEMAGREAVVLPQIQGIEGLQGVSSLRQLTGAVGAEFPQALIQEPTVRTVHAVLEQELENTAIYRQGEEPTRELHRVEAGAPPVTEAPAPSDSYFRGIDPRQEKAVIPINSSLVIWGAESKGVGNAFLCVGGKECEHLSLAFGDASHISGATSRGGRDYQQDGIYLSSFLLPDGTVVKILAGSDGAGGHVSGEVASSAFLQGVHAAVADAARDETIPTAGTLFEHGKAAVLKQLELNPESRGATGTGAVIVVVGNQAMIASAGDSMVTFLRKNTSGLYETVGYTDTELLPQGYTLGNSVLGSPTLYLVENLRPSDRLFIGSDGLWENLLGFTYKERGGVFLRFVNEMPIPDQALFHNLNLLARVTESDLERAVTLHYWANHNIASPGGGQSMGGETLILPGEADLDNIFALDYRHGQGLIAVPIGIPPGTYKPLEPVDD